MSGPQPLLVWPYKSTPTSTCYFLIQTQWLQAFWVLGSFQVCLQPETLVASLHSFPHKGNLGEQAAGEPPDIPLLIRTSAMHVQKWRQRTTIECFLLSLSQYKWLVGCCQKFLKLHHIWDFSREADHPGDYNIKSLGQIHQNRHLEIYEDSNYSIETPLYLSSARGFRALVQALYWTYRFEIML